MISKFVSLLSLVCFMSLLTPLAQAEPEVPIFTQNTRILFQGDSITDGNRGRSADPNHILGHGYVFIIAAKYGAQMPERRLSFMNRGISGNKVSDLLGRWQTDTLDLKPDVLSILIGVNDASAGVPLDKYEADLDKLMQDTLAANPNTCLVLCEPFTLPGTVHKDDWITWRANIQSRQDAVARLASKYQVPLVHFQRAFDEAIKRAPANYWIWDTIHPTYSGHQIMADEWVRTVSQFHFPAKPFVPVPTVAAPQ
ncbi:acetylxylan esterase [Abditibacteriota bacterium]|nr:acetylxylan esterase [Abditibacteriota bacterium]